MVTKEILDNFEKEQKELSIKNDNDYKERKRIDEFLQYKFNERYLFKSILIMVPSAIAMGCWVVHGSTFNDGLLRFLIGSLVSTLAIIVIKKIIFNKIKEEFALDVNDDEKLE